MISKIRISAFAFLFAALSGVMAPAVAVQPDEMLADPAKESLARSISSELRCPVCQNQSIDESDAPLSRDLRILVREQIQAGKNRDEILDFAASRFGDFVLLKPRFSIRNMVLWLTPLLLLMFGGIVVYSMMRGGRRQSATPAPLSDLEKAKLSAILGEKP